MTRFATVVASLGIVIGLVACCCPMRGPRFGVPPIVVNPPRVQVPPLPPPVDPPPPPIKQPPVVVDPTEAMVQQMGGRVVRDEGQPNRPVVEVNLNFTKLQDADLKKLASLTGLRRLSLSQNPGVTGVGFRDLAALESLEFLDVNFCPITDEGMAQIAGFKNLKTLHVIGGKLSDPGFREIAKLDRLEELVASGMLLNGPSKKEPTDDAIKELGRLKQLRKVDLGNTHFGDQSAAEFAGLTQLKSLHAVGSYVTDVGMLELAKLKQLEELRVGYRISDKGLAAFTGNTHLLKLSVWNSSGITDASAPVIGSMSSLRELDVGSTRISIKGRVEIRKALPQCKLKK